MDSNRNFQIAAIASIAMLDALLGMTLFTALSLNKNKRKHHGVSGRPRLGKRLKQSELEVVVETEDDEPSHKCSSWMTTGQFDKIHDAVADLITKQNTRMKKAISSRDRLAITLRYLASGDMQTSLSFAYGISKSSVSNIIKETCAAIWTALQPTCLPSLTEERLQDISDDFSTIWNMPNCVGAIDGKHISIECSIDGSSKDACNTVLLAMCDAKYKFTYADIGRYAPQSDGGIFKASQLGQFLESSSFPWPNKQKFPNTDIDFPHYIVGSDAFPLRSFLMRSYPGKGLAADKLIFNYRLGRARKMSENTFGIFAARWRIFKSSQATKSTTVDEVVKACVCLHNFLMSDTESDHGQSTYCPHDLIDRESFNGNVIGGKWRTLLTSDNGLLRIGQVSSNYFSHNSASLRDQLKDYLNGVGAVSWQTNAAHKNNI